MSKGRSKALPGTFWRGNVLYGRTRVNGRLLCWSLQTSDPKVAAQRRQAGKDRVIAIKHDDYSWTFVEVLEAWSPWIAKQVGPATAERYAGSLEQLMPYLAGKLLREIDGRLIAAIITERSKKVSNATVKRDLGALSSVINFAIDQGWCEANPVLPRLGRIKERRDPIVLPKVEHIGFVGDMAPGMVSAVMKAAMVTGARQGELLRAQRGHVDDERRQMTLIGKGNKLRVIDLEPFNGYATLTGLTTYAESRERYLFWHGAGRPYSNKSFKGNFTRLMGRAASAAKSKGLDFQPFRFHDLRHWHAVQWLKSGRSIYDLQHRLGHTSIQVTEGYCKYLTSEEERIVKAPGITKSISASDKAVIPRA
jgi:integrase/recombinase XerD